MNTKGRRRLSLLCLVGIAMLGMISCNMLTLNEEPTAVETTTKLGGYPDIQATINASIDTALALVDTAAERSVELDPRYATLSRALRRERDGEWATERVLDPARTDELTEEEGAEIDSLLADDPELDAAFAELADELEAVYAAIPTIEIRVQELDENDEPIGETYTIRSENGVIEFSDRTIVSEEFLLWIQSHDPGPERGFVIDRNWYHSDFGSGRAWPNDRVKYFFDSSIPEDSADRSWMWSKLHRTQHATSIRFTEYSNTSSRRYAWNRGSSPYLRISRAELGTTPGTATLGKVSKSFLRMDHGTGRTETGENKFYHEVGHVLGLIHEHQRYDRDNHVIMSPYKAYYDANYAKIRERRRQMFWFLWWSWYSWVDNSTTYGTPYDYHSIMHYPADNGTTIHRSDGAAIGTSTRETRANGEPRITTRTLRLGTSIRSSVDTA